MGSAVFVAVVRCDVEVVGFVGLVIFSVCFSTNPVFFFAICLGSYTHQTDRDHASFLILFREHRPEIGII